MTDPKPPVGQQAEPICELCNMTVGEHFGMICATNQGGWFKSKSPIFCGSCSHEKGYHEEVSGCIAYECECPKFSKPVASPVTLSGETRGCFHSWGNCASASRPHMCCQTKAHTQPHSCTYCEAEELVCCSSSSLR